MLGERGRSALSLRDSSVISTANAVAPDRAKAFDRLSYLLLECVFPDGAQNCQRYHVSLGL